MGTHHPGSLTEATVLFRVVPTVLQSQLISGTFDIVHREVVLYQTEPGILGELLQSREAKLAADNLSGRLAPLVPAVITDWFAVHHNVAFSWSGATDQSHLPGTYVENKIIVYGAILLPF